MWDLPVFRVSLCDVDHSRAFNYLWDLPVFRVSLCEYFLYKSEESDELFFRKSILSV